MSKQQVVLKVPLYGLKSVPLGGATGCRAVLMARQVSTPFGYGPTPTVSVTKACPLAALTWVAMNLPAVGGECCAAQGVGVMRSQPAARAREW